MYGGQGSACLKEPILSWGYLICPREVNKVSESDICINAMENRGTINLFILNPISDGLSLKCDSNSKYKLVQKSATTLVPSINVPDSDFNTT